MKFLDKNTIYEVFIDIFVFGGIGLIGYGLWLLYPPIAFAVVGLILLLLGLHWSKK